MDEDNKYLKDFIQTGRCDTEEYLDIEKKETIEYYKTELKKYINSEKTVYVNTQKVDFESERLDE